ncbi:MAG: DUF4276 family protein [Planctomycetes bacterium]|nr:DUF4276 family protein [Planctomycetota bacterium]
MARLLLTAEGYTEQRFALELLKEHLAKHEVYLSKPRLASLGKKKGHVHRGGLVRYEPVKEDIRRWLKEDQDSNAYFTTIFDLYALPGDFPGSDEASKLADPRARVRKLEEAFGEDIQDPRFIPYIQLHEFEAILLSDPAAFDCLYQEHARQIDQLKKLCKDYKSPELIDDGEQSAPSKRIEKEIPEYHGAKATAGPIIAAEIGLETIRDKCPHFNDWLTQLEGLNKNAPDQ